jgi:hypothetical protein
MAAPSWVQRNSIARRLAASLPFASAGRRSFGQQNGLPPDEKVQGNKQLRICLVLMFNGVVQRQAAIKAPNWNIFECLFLIEGAG